jgi:hypothetical protein
LKFTEQLVVKIQPLLKSAGFRRVARHWYKSNGEVTQVINLQQSRWGNWTYVNCAVQIDRLNQVKNPKHYECPLEFRLEWVVPGELGELVQGKQHDLLSNDPVEPTEDDADQFVFALKTYGLPYLDRFISEAEIVRLVSDAPTERDRNFANRLAEKILDQKMDHQ